MKSVLYRVAPKTCDLIWFKATNVFSWHELARNDGVTLAMTYLTLTPETLTDQHICCAISDKKCAAGYAAKKHWLADEYARGYRFHRLDERGKVFIEYGPGDQSWQPLDAKGWMVLGCFWVSGKFKKQGHGTALLEQVQKDAHAENCHGIATVVGTKKMHFMSDGKWLKKMGFEEVDRLDSGFSLLVNTTKVAASDLPRFSKSARAGLSDKATGVHVYYSNRCPFTEHHVTSELSASCAARNLSLSIHKIDSLEKARNSPCPATIFALFRDGQFVTTDISACLDKRFDKVMTKAGFT